MLGIVKALGIVILLITGVEAHTEKKHILDTSKEAMQVMADALGVECSYCHPSKKEDGEPDFAAASEMKTIALFMKKNMVDKFVKKGGDPIDCAFCHQGKARFLVRDSSLEKPSRVAGMATTEIVELMKGMQRGLGVSSCDHCHERGDDGRLDHAIPTQQKVISRQMMDHFTDALLQLKNGKPARCESCHSGKVTFVPRDRHKGKGR
jgi:hypothetical protein